MGRVLRIGLAWLVALLVCAGSAHAQPPSALAFATTTGNVTLTTTTENVAVSSGPALLARPTGTVCALGWAQLTTGVATTTVTPRIRRGTAITGTLVGEANAVTIGAVAGSNEQFWALACEERSGTATVEYSFTLLQTSASGNGTVLQAGILVFVQ